MIVPAPQNFVAYIGGSFDSTPTFYAPTSTTLKWLGNWANNIRYSVNNVAVGSDTRAYQCIQANAGIDPTTDTGIYWTPLATLNLTGYTAELVIEDVPGGTPMLTLTGGSGITLGGTAGTVRIQLTPIQTALFSNNEIRHYFLQMTDTVGNVYYYLDGQITFQSP